MGVRAGMANLLERLRSLTHAGTADFSIDDVSYFSDSQLQDILDSNVTFMNDYPLTWQPDVVGGGTIEYRSCSASPYRDFEESTSGTTHWIVRDGQGGTASCGTSAYTPDYITGRLMFTANQGGAAYYLTARSYDLYSAAADVWLRRQAYYADWYEFSSDDQRFARQQAYDHAVQMEKNMRGRAGQNSKRGVFRTAVFVRGDVNPSEV
jgi:hypothetical protein